MVGNFRDSSSYHFEDKVSKGAKIRNRYNQVPHMTQGTNGKVTNSQLDTTNESQEVSPFTAGDHKAHINRRSQRHSKQKTEKNIKDPQKKHRLGTVSKMYAHVGLFPNWWYFAFIKGFLKDDFNCSFRYFGWNEPGP